MAQAITSSSSQWGYSVPLEETDGNAGARLPPPRAKRQTPQTSQQHDRDPRTMKSQTRRPSDIGIQSDSEETRQRRKTVKAGNATATATRKRSRNALRSGAVSAASGRERSLDPPGNFDDSAWIHRDKLAQIEIQEMVDAGIPVRHSRRSLSAGPAAAARDSRSPSPSRGEEEESVYEQSEEQYEYSEEYSNGYEEFERKRISTIDQAEEEEDQYYDGTTNGHYNTPREAVAQDSETTPPSSSNHHARPSTSRIPVSTASAVPVPHNVVGRDSPLPRSRHGSQAASGNWEDLMYARRGRSTSVGSHVLLDDDTLPRPESSYKISSANNSPPKARTPGKAGPYGQRKVSTPTTARPGSSASKKPPTTNNNNAASSPTTTTAHRSNSRSSRPPLEGDPPWVTDMYKPDPRLPPDQQMLPTHARRLAQENWERNAGKTPASVYDRELRPLNDRDPSPNLPRDDSANEENASSSPIDATKNADGGLMLDTTAQTLDPTTTNLQRREFSEKGSPTKSTTAGGGGGYKITPTIVSPPEIQRSPYSSHAGGMSADPSSAAGMRQGGGNGGEAGGLDEKKGAFDGGDEGDGGKKKSGGCGCCVVM